jgi:uncharacterized membrane protein
MMPPFWALTLVFWLHLLATVIWIGSLAVLGVFVLPSARQVLDLRTYAQVSSKILQHITPWIEFSLVLLAATGLFQMVANPHYHGFLAITNRWAVAILVKHLLFGVMILLTFYSLWGVQPALRRAALRPATGDHYQDQALKQLQTRELLLIRINLCLGVLVLVLTAAARAA